MIVHGDGWYWFNQAGVIRTQTFDFHSHYTEGSLQICHKDNWISVLENKCYVSLISKNIFVLQWSGSRWTPIITRERSFCKFWHKRSALGHGYPSASGGKRGNWLCALPFPIFSCDFCVHSNTSCMPEMCAKELAFLSFWIKLFMAIQSVGLSFPTNWSIFL